MCVESRSEGTDANSALYTFLHMLDTKNNFNLWGRLPREQSNTNGRLYQASGSRALFCNYCFKPDNFTPVCASEKRESSKHENILHFFLVLSRISKAADVCFDFPYKHCQPNTLGVHNYSNQNLKPKWSCLSLIKVHHHSKTLTLTHTKGKNRSLKQQSKYIKSHTAKLRKNAYFLSILLAA